MNTPGEISGGTVHDSRCLAAAGCWRWGEGEVGGKYKTAHMFTEGTKINKIAAQRTL